MGFTNNKHIEGTDVKLLLPNKRELVQCIHISLFVVLNEQFREAMTRTSRVVYFHFYDYKNNYNFFIYENLNSLKTFNLRKNKLTFLTEEPIKSILDTLINSF